MPNGDHNVPCPTLIEMAEMKTQELEREKRLRALAEEEIESLRKQIDALTSTIEIIGQKE